MKCNISDANWLVPLAVCYCQEAIVASSALSVTVRHFMTIYRASGVWHFERSRRALRGCLGGVGDQAKAVSTSKLFKLFTLA